MIVQGSAQAAADFESPASSDEAERARAVECLATAVRYEAGYEPVAGQQAVAEVILNRLRKPGYPKTVCGVVYQGAARKTGCQFSFTCDGSLNKVLPAALNERARQIAIDAIDGRLPLQTFGATHYHADYILPYWASSLMRVAVIGHHVFYRATAASGTRIQAIAQKFPMVSTPLRLARTFMPWGLPVSAILAETQASNE